MTSYDAPFVYSLGPSHDRALLDVLGGYVSRYDRVRERRWEKSIRRDAFAPPRASALTYLYQHGLIETAGGPDEHGRRSVQLTAAGQREAVRAIRLIAEAYRIWRWLDDEGEASADVDPSDDRRLIAHLRALARRHGRTLSTEIRDENENAPRYSAHRIEWFRMYGQAWPRRFRLTNLAETG